MPLIRIELPAHLRNLARTSATVTISVTIATLAGAITSLEAAYPMLEGTIRDHATGRRRPFIRFFACEEDLSHLPEDTPLPAAVAEGTEPLIILGAIAGG